MCMMLTKRIHLILKQKTLDFLSVRFTKCLKSCWCHQLSVELSTNASCPLHRSSTLPNGEFRKYLPIAQTSMWPLENNNPEAIPEPDSTSITCCCSGEKNSYTFISYISLLVAAGLLLLNNDMHASEISLIEKRERLLMQACLTNELMVIRQLIKEGVNVNCAHPLGWTPLMVASINGHLPAVKLLLEAKANPNLADGYSYAARVAKDHGTTPSGIQQIRDREFFGLLEPRSNFRGCTALHYAALADKLPIMEALISAGADPLIKSAVGHKASQYATPQLQARFKEWEETALRRHQEMEAELRRKYPLEQRLKERIVGQEGAINVVAAAVRRKENGWFDDDRPLVMLFLGSSGIGKTELAKQLANYIHGNVKDAFIRIDMSEYQSKHEAAKFIGAPPGYIGHEEGGQLTERLSKHPSAVVLFDEVDKAHPDVLTTLLQLFDEGHLTDGKGKRINCKQAIFIMTANVANEEISQHALELRETASNITQGKLSTSMPNKSDLAATPELSREFKDTVIHPILKRHFKRDEFLGRINEIVYFLPFTDAELHQLVRRQLEFWRGKAKAVHGMELTWDDAVLDTLSLGYDVHYGARSIIYEVERQVISKLAAAQEKGLIQSKDHLHLTSTGESGIVISKVTPDGKKISVQKTSLQQTLPVI